MLGTKKITPSRLNIDIKEFDLVSNMATTLTLAVGNCIPEDYSSTQVFVLLD